MRKQDGGPLVSEPVHTHAHGASFTELGDMETKILNDVAEKEDVYTRSDETKVCKCPTC